MHHLDAYNQIKYASLFVANISIFGLFNKPPISLPQKCNRLKIISHMNSTSFHFSLFNKGSESENNCLFRLLRQKRTISFKLGPPPVRDWGMIFCGVLNQEICTIMLWCLHSQED